MNEEKMDELLRLMRAVVPDTSDMSDAGRVGFVYRQNYDPAVQYEELDVVKFGMSLWTPKTVTIGNPPPDQSQEGQENVEENDFWVMFLPGALGSDYVKKTDLSRPPTETEAGTPGVNFPDGKTIQIDENGMLTGTPLDFMGTWKSLQEGIASGEIKDGMIGYIRGDSENEEDSDHPNAFLFPVDDFLSQISSNAVQNRIVTAALERLEQLENETRALRASLESFGLSKICPVDLTDVTEDNGMVLGAVEKNASLTGTLANLIEENSTFRSSFDMEDVSSKFVRDTNNTLGGSISAYKFGKIIAFSGIVVPKESNMKEAVFFDITDNKLFPKRLSQFFLTRYAIVNIQGFIKFMTSGKITGSSTLGGANTNQEFGGVYLTN